MDPQATPDESRSPIPEVHRFSEIEGGTLSFQGQPCHLHIVFWTITRFTSSKSNVHSMTALPKDDSSFILHSPEAMLAPDRAP